ncbi:hypothetical protein ACFIJ5_07390 [Haloimpatiens sp. FM7330]|uniref:hypothetical protein n=1 Tax=Haloimpatiens sp. FM7330 TaxID=3298610 RepID=UPI003634F200
MIKIRVNEGRMKKIEEKHWKWFWNNYNKTITRCIEAEEEEFYYKKYNEKTKKYDIEEKITDIEIKRFLSYINKTNAQSEPEILKIIIVGKLINEENKKESIRYITENILKKFPKIFCCQIQQSVKSFLKNKKIIMKNIKCSDRNNSNEFNKVKNCIKDYFKINKDILNIYVDTLDDINLKIDQINLTEKQVRNFNENTFIKFKYNGNEEFIQMQKILLNIFNYKLFTDEGKEEGDDWGAYSLLKELDITTCPYCNRNYIHTYIGKEGMCRADIDHFYPKSKYPFLAVSLYNFIPSCHTCNSSFKNVVDTFLLPHLYPYENEFDEEAKFKTSFYTGEDNKNEECEKDNVSQKKEEYDISYLLGNSDNFKIEIKPKDCESETGKKIQNSIDTFQLEELYNFHKDYVRELIKKAIIYNESRIDELYTQYPELFSSREEVLQMVVSNYICDEDLGKRPLSKLTKDICDELGLK